MSCAGFACNPQGQHTVFRQFFNPKSTFSRISGDSLSKWIEFSFRNRILTSFSAVNFDSAFITLALSFLSSKSSAMASSALGITIMEYVKRWVVGLVCGVIFNPKPLLVFMSWIQAGIKDNYLRMPSPGRKIVTNDMQISTRSRFVMSRLPSFRVRIVIRVKNETSIFWQLTHIPNAAHIGWNIPISAGIIFNFNKNYKNTYGAVGTQKPPRAALLLRIEICEAKNEQRTGNPFPNEVRR